MRVTDLGPLETARKARGWTQSELAERSGVQQGNISAYERSNIPLGVAAAKRLAKALDANPALLVIHSQQARVEAAMRRGDAIGALNAAKAVVRAPEELPLEDEDEKALSRMVAQVVDFAGSVGTEEDKASYGYDPDEGRDPVTGVKVAGKARNSADEDTSLAEHLGQWDFGLGPDRPHGLEHPDVDDGRDIHGNRVAPLPEREDR